MWLNSQWEENAITQEDANCMIVHICYSLMQSKYVITSTNFDPTAVRPVVLAQVPLMWPEKECNALCALPTHQEVGCAVNCSCGAHAHGVHTLALLHEAQK